MLEQPFDLLLCCLALLRGVGGSHLHGIAATLGVRARELGDGEQALDWHAVSRIWALARKDRAVRWFRFRLAEPRRGPWSLCADLPVGVRFGNLRPRVVECLGR